MGAIKNMLFELMRDFEPFYSTYDPYIHNQTNKKSDTMWVINLPYLDLNKLNCYVEGGYLYIEYDNPEDERRKLYRNCFYVGTSQVEVKYENGFLKIKKDEKKPERKIITVS